MEKEIWKNINGYNGKYQVSNLGNVRSTDRYYKQANRYSDNCEHIYKGKTLKPFYTKWGYKRVGLSQNGKVKYFCIHKLVAETFLNNPNSLPQVNHIDGNKENNNVNNLEWCNCAYNNRHARIIGLNKGNKGISYKNRCLKAIEYIMSNLITEWDIKNDGCVSGSDLPVDAITPILNILNGSDENE